MITPKNNGSKSSHASHPAARGTLRIAETFVSRQGEGLLTGTDSFFIRTSGCNLRCWFCDTPYASWAPEGEQIQVDELVRQALGSELRHVVVTGGEPLLPRSITELCGELTKSGIHVTIETAGTVDRQVSCDLMSISPKLASSSPDAVREPRWHSLHQLRRLPLETMRRLMDRSPRFQIKFVIESPDDYPEILSVIDQLRVDPGDVWLMPQGCTVSQLDATAQWLKPWCEQQGFHYCDRMQIRWFGNRRGT